MLRKIAAGLRPVAFILPWIALIVSVGVFGIVITGNHEQTMIPQNHLRCYHFHRQEIVLLDSATRNPSRVLTIRSGQQCEWEWLSDEEYGIVHTWANPPVILWPAGSKAPLVLPGNTMFTAFPPGTKVRIKGDQIVVKGSS